MKTRMFGARGGMLRRRTWSCCQRRSESWFARWDNSRHALVKPALPAAGRTHAAEERSTERRARARGRSIARFVLGQALPWVSAVASTHEHPYGSCHHQDVHVHICTLRSSAMAAPDLNLSHTRDRGDLPDACGEISRFNPLSHSLHRTTTQRSFTTRQRGCSRSTEGHSNTLVSLRFFARIPQTRSAWPKRGESSRKMGRNPSRMITGPAYLRVQEAWILDLVIEIDKRKTALYTALHLLLCTAA